MRRRKILGELRSFFCYQQKRFAAEAARANRKSAKRTFSVCFRKHTIRIYEWWIGENHRFFRDTLKPVMQKEVRPIRKGEYKYPYKILIGLTKSQEARLQSLASKSGLSMSAYVRQLIDGVLPQERPPLDFYLILSQLRYIGNNMNQLTRIAHATGRIDWKEFERLTDEIKPLASMLYRYVTEPIKRDPMTSELGTYIRKSDQKVLKEKREEERKWR